MPSLPYARLDGAGNDFVLLLAEEVPADTPRPALARTLCNRQTSLGADQLLILHGRQDTYDLEVWNADGSPAEMCGNGLRAIGQYLYETRRDTRALFTIDVAGRSTHMRRHQDGSFAVDMGVPIVEPEVVVEVNAVSVRLIPVQVGNPHAVCFTDALEDLPQLGPALSRHPRFPNGANIHLVRRCASHEVTARVWERGSGETSACGSGAAAITAAGVSQGLVASPLDVRYPGGVLRGTWEDHGCVQVGGPARVLATGTVRFHAF